MTLRALRTAPLLLLCLASCKKEGGTPAFLRISDPKAETAAGGTIVTSAITDIWVYANGEPVGVWQPDRRIPILNDGDVNITLIAGVRRNGISSDRIQYPFIATFTQSVQLEPGAEYTLEPVFTYFEDASWVEDFDNTTGFQFDFAEGDTSFVQLFDDTDSAEVLSGAGGAAIALDATNDMCRAVCDPSVAFPGGSDPAFLEVDVRSDTRLLVGVRYVLGGQTFTVPYVYVSPTVLPGGTPQWNHLYIDLRSAWGTGALLERTFYLEAKLEDGATSARIALDNIKVFY